MINTIYKFTEFLLDRLEDLYALRSNSYVKSIEVARTEYLLGNVKVHEEVFNC